MTMTAPPRTSKAAAIVPSTATNLREMERELNLIFLERTEVLRALFVTLLAAANGFILGPPGTAKSEMLEMLCMSFPGAKYFRVLMDKMMGKEDIAGAIDVPDYVKNGHWGRDITDTLMDCHLALLDETGNTGPLVMNTMLTAMNERRNKPNGKWIDIPAISIFGASNFYLEDMPAAWDRFLTRVEVDDIQEDANFEIFLARKAGTIAIPPITTLVALADLQYAIKHDVPAVTLPSGVQDAIRQLRVDLRGEGINASTRRWGQATRLVQANAFLEGRTVADEDDLQPLQHCLWENPTDRLTVKRKVLALTSPVTKLAVELAGMLDSISAEVDARTGMNVSTSDRAAYGGTAQFEINEIQTKLTEGLEDANRQGRSTTQLAAVGQQIKTLRAKVYVVCMNVTPERAANMP